MAGSHGDGGTNAVQMGSQGKSARSEKQLFSFFPARAVGRQHHKCRALSTQGLPVRKPKVCAELADLRRGFHRVLRTQSPCSNTHMCKEEPWLGSVPSSGSRIIREPGCSLAVLPLGEHRGCPLVALSTLLASFASGGCQAESSQGSSRATQVIAAAHPSPACVLSVTVEAPWHLQHLPKAGQILLRISFIDQHTGFWATSMVPMFHLET